MGLLAVLAPRCAKPTCEASRCTDAGLVDAGRRDGGVTDAGEVDAGLHDTDAGAEDSGARDGGLDDAGWPDAGTLPPSPLPQAESSLEQWLDLDWELTADLPVAMQGNAAGYVGGDFIVAGGHNQRDAVPGKDPAAFLGGFHSRAFFSAVDGGQWLGLPDLPGPPRQGMAVASSDDALFVLGGFNDDGSTTDAWRLSKDGGTWRWAALPPLPTGLTEAGAAVLGGALYLVGGGDYGPPTFAALTERARDGGFPRLGARLWKLELAAPSAWQELDSLPGTPRSNAAVAAVGGRLVVFGGTAFATAAAVSSPRNCNVADSWAYTPATNQWTRLRDTPTTLGLYPRGQLTWRDRYVLLPGGYDFGCLAFPDGGANFGVQRGRGVQTFPRFGTYNDVLVYDAQADSFGRASHLPQGNVGPVTVVRGDVLWLTGGEIGRTFWGGRFFPNQPDLSARARISFHRAGHESFVPLGILYTCFVPDGGANVCEPLASASWPGAGSIDGRDFDVLGTCQPDAGPVMVFGPGAAASASASCDGGFFSRSLHYAGQRGAQSVAVEQQGRRAQNLSLFFEL